MGLLEDSACINLYGSRRSRHIPNLELWPHLRGEYDESEGDVPLNTYVLP